MNEYKYTKTFPYILIYFGGEYWIRTNAPIAR